MNNFDEIRIDKGKVNKFGTKIDPKINSGQEKTPTNTCWSFKYVENSKRLVFFEFCVFVFKFINTSCSINKFRFTSVKRVRSSRNL